MSAIDQYKAHMQDLGNIGSRQETSRRFYFTLLSGLSVFLTLSGPEGPISAVQGLTLFFVGLAGCALCFLWHIHMLSYRAIFSAKFTVLREIETQKDLFPMFGNEGTALQAHDDYRRVTQIDSLPPVVFGLLIAAITAALLYKQFAG